MCVESIHLASVNILKWITPTRKMQVILILRIVRVRMKFNWDEKKRDRESDMFAKPIFLPLIRSVVTIHTTHFGICNAINRCMGIMLFEWLPVVIVRRITYSFKCHLLHELIVYSCPLHERESLQNNIYRTRAPEVSESIKTEMCFPHTDIVTI